MSTYNETITDNLRWCYLPIDTPLKGLLLCYQNTSCNLILQNFLQLWIYWTSLENVLTSNASQYQNQEPDEDSSDVWSLIAQSERVAKNRWYIYEPFTLQMSALVYWAAHWLYSVYVCIVSDWDVYNSVPLITDMTNTTITSSIS